MEDHVLGSHVSGSGVVDDNEWKIINGVGIMRKVEGVNHIMFSFPTRCRGYGANDAVLRMLEC